MTEPSVSPGWWPAVRSGELVVYLDDIEHERLMGVMTVADVEAGESILHKGSASRSLLVVEEGEIEILDESLGETVILGRVGAGGVVGEVGFLDGRPRTHHVRAATRCRLRRLTREALLDLVKDDSTLYAKITIALSELLARRFRAALAELEPVRAFAASLREPEDTVDEMARPATLSPRADEPSDGPSASPGSFDEVEPELPEQAMELLRELARKPLDELAGV